MLKFHIIILSFLSVSFLSSCYESDPIGEEDRSDEPMNLNGRVYIKDEPVEGMYVQLDTNPEWTDSTNEYGAFEIKNVSFGSHHFLASKIFNDSVSVYVNKTVQMDYDGVYMNEIIFPDIPIIYAPRKSSSADKGLDIRWSKTLDNGFEKYEIYKSEYPDFNYNSGVMIKRSANNLDTLATDVNITENKIYYYKVYSYFINGRISGSRAAQGSFTQSL